MVKTVDSDFEREEVRVVEPGAAAMLKSEPLRLEPALGRGLGRRHATIRQAII